MSWRLGGALVVACAIGVAMLPAAGPDAASTTPANPTFTKDIQPIFQQHGFNEDFGFPNSVRLAVQPGSLLQGEENRLMVQVAALEAIRTGTTTIVENAGGIGRTAPALAATGLRCVFAESIRDSENVAGPMAPAGLARSVAPTFSTRLRDEGMQQISDLFTAVRGCSRRTAGTWTTPISH